MSLFSYFQLGLKAMHAARVSLQVAGDNIAHIGTPGYARRRVELVPSYPVRVPGGWLDQGADVAAVRRMEDRFLQAALERELGRRAGAEERLRALQAVERLYGTLESNNLGAALSAFAAAFEELAGQPENFALRRTALSAAETLARTIRDTYARLQEQRQREDQAVEAAVARVRELALELARLNREIAAHEADGTTAGPVRDQRQRIVEELAEWTGGTAVAEAGGRVSFALPGGPTLVSGDAALPLAVERDANGLERVRSGADGTDITARVRQGRLGALLAARDEILGERLEELDRLAEDLTVRVNAVVTAAFDRSGNPGAALFVPDPPTQPSHAARIAVNAALLADPALLAVSATGAPGDGAAAREVAEVVREPSAALGGRDPIGFVADSLTRLGSAIVETDVVHGVAEELVAALQARRDAVSGVSLDEEAVELIRQQRAFEAAARFLGVMNEITAMAVNLGR